MDKKEDNPRPIERKSGLEDSMTPGRTKGEVELRTKGKQIDEIKNIYKNTPAWKLLSKSNEEKTLCLIHLLELTQKLEEKVSLYEQWMRDIEAELAEHREKREVKEIVDRLETNPDPDLMTEAGGNC